jgi:hypothetical protein
VAEVTIRRFVRERKRELGWATRATCVPQSYAPGQEGQVDWYEAWAEPSGEQVLLQVFAMRSMASEAAFHRAYQRATQQAFPEAHEHAFDFLAEFWVSQLRLCGEPHNRIGPHRLPRRSIRNSGSGFHKCVRRPHGPSPPNESGASNPEC